MRISSENDAWEWRIFEDYKWLIKENCFIKIPFKSALNLFWRFSEKHYDLVYNVKSLIKSNNIIVCNSLSKNDSNSVYNF